MECHLNNMPQCNSGLRTIVMSIATECNCILLFSGQGNSFLLFEAHGYRKGPKQDKPFKPSRLVCHSIHQMIYVLGIHRSLFEPTDISYQQHSRILLSLILQLSSPHKYNNKQYQVYVSISYALVLILKKIQQ